MDKRDLLDVWDVEKWGGFLRWKETQPEFMRLDGHIPDYAIHEFEVYWDAIVNPPEPKKDEPQLELPLEEVKTDVSTQATETPSKD